MLSRLSRSVSDMERMTPRVAGAELAKSAPPLTDEQVEKAARILATVVAEL